MQLIPVIEFEPSPFQIHPRDYPNGSKYEYPVEWHNYWKNSLADSGINDLEPCYPDSWLVEISKLTTPILEILLTKQHELEAETIETGSLCGGYIFSSATAHFMPQCCGSLRDISEWEMAADWMDTTTSTMLWIGHPWLTVKAIDDRSIQITDDDGDTFQIDRQELRMAIDTTQQELANFKKILLPAVLN